jgi:allophanate hydrolase
MNTARLRVDAAGPLTTVQDRGRFGLMRYGVPWSGPVDALAFAAAQAAAAAPPGAPAIELSRGGLTLSVADGALRFALAGGGFRAVLNGIDLGAWVAGALTAGDRLTVRDSGEGNWAYLAFGGGLEARRWAGSVSTLALSNLGGGRIEAGAELLIAGCGAPTGEARSLPHPALADGPIRVVPGPQDQHFSGDALAALTGEAFALTPRMDRMGVRLAGPLLVPTGIAMLSEGAARGSVQVDGSGTASVLLADHQTTGGYPKIATVIGPDLARLAQRPAGQAFRFAAVSAEEANEAARQAAAGQAAYLSALAAPGGLDQRLWAANLISGAVRADPGAA